MAAIKATARPDADARITLADGRTLTYCEWGNPTGSPVLLVHGGPGSRLLCPDEDATAAAGVRLLTVDGPGYGGSDPRPDPTLLGWADDVQALADRLGLERFAVVGFSAGGGYALACAARMPERICAVGLACCEGPYDEVPGALEQGMTPEERSLFERIRRDSVAARPAVAEHVAWYQDPDTIWAWEREDPTVEVPIPPAVDAPILARPDVRDALTQMWREGARQGVGGLVDDWIALSLPWGFAFADVKVPVVVWHGELDHLVGPAHAHYFSAVLPNSTLVLYPQEGHLLLLQHWSDILPRSQQGPRPRTRLPGGVSRVVEPRRSSMRPWPTTSCVATATNPSCSLVEGDDRLPHRGPPTSARKASPTDSGGINAGGGR